MFFQGFPGFIDFCSVGQSLKHRIPGKIQLEKCITHRGRCFYPAPLPALSSTVPCAGRNPGNSQLATKTFTLRTGTPSAIPSIQEVPSNVVGASKEIPATLPPCRTVARRNSGRKGAGDFPKSMDCVQLPSGTCDGSARASGGQKIPGDSPGSGSFLRHSQQVLGILND